MKILVTAGNTQAPIDQVRCLTNIFTGRTGAAIAGEAYRRGHHVTLLTSHPESLRDWSPCPETLDSQRWQVVAYRTFEDLEKLLEQQFAKSSCNVVIHAAAVGDYRVSGVYAPAPGTAFDASAQRWRGSPGQQPALVDRAAGKVKSDEPELWLRLVRAPKLIDRMRSDWGFAGTLVKFKLEVGLPDAELLRGAEAARLHSQADLMVANTLEEAAHWAFLGPLAGRYEKVTRDDLARRLLEEIEAFL